MLVQISKTITLFQLFNHQGDNELLHLWVFLFMLLFSLLIQTKKRVTILAIVNKYTYWIKENYTPSINALHRVFMLCFEIFFKKFIQSRLELYHHYYRILLHIIVLLKLCVPICFSMTRHRVKHFKIPW